MRITYVELYNYQRLKNKGINRIKLDFNEIIQVIIGKNGGGKSSLMRELSPLPPDNSDYAKGGTKTIIIEHKGMVYELVSSTGSPSRHSFLCNGDEQNLSKNMQAQKELVEVHFGYTEQIHELMLGLVNGVSFTGMSPAKRKEWLMTLYPNDLTYVNNLHDIFKTMLRDTRGGLKTNSAHLTGLYEQRGTGLTTDDMQARIDNLQIRRDRIARLVSEQISTDNHQQNIDQTFVDLSRLVGQRRNPVSLSRHYTCRDDIMLEINNAQSELQRLEYAHQTHSKELTELANNEVFKQAASLEDKQRLEIQRDELTKQLRQDSDNWALSSNHYKNLPIWTTILSMDENAQRNLIASGSDLVLRLQNMIQMDNREVTTRSYDAVTKLKYDLTPQIEQKTDVTGRLTHKLKHLESADRTECPSCHHRWLPGVTPAQVQELRDQLKREQAELDGLVERRTKCDKYLSDYSAWYQTTCSYIRFIVGRDDLSVLLDWFAEQGVMYTGGKGYAAVLPGMFDALIIKHRLINRKLELDQVVQRLKLFDSDAVEWHQRRYQEHEDALNRIIDEQRDARLKLATYTGDLRVVDDANSMVAQLKQKQGYIHEQVGALAQQTITRVANSEHHALGDEQRQLTTQLYNSRSLEGSISSTEQHLEEMKENAELLKLAVKATSPMEGFVAEQLSEFIACFIGNMNVGIDEVWDDVLQILPCSIDDGSLSYKFPLLSGEFQCETKDIAESSTGEAQIINWIFRLVVMDYLNFNQYPLYLDEVGANFDEKHRPKMMSFIKKCASDGKYSQIFLISHYMAQHGVLTHAEVCALSTDGVALPEKYNEHVVIN